MRLKEIFEVESIWKRTVDYDFNVLRVSPIFKDDWECLVTGCASGNIRVHQPNDKEDVSKGFDQVCKRYETKGSSIQTLHLENVTRFNSHDALVGDSKGVFTIITNGQILNRRSVCASKITSQTCLTDSAGNISIVTGSSCGTLVYVTPYDVLWRCRLAEMLKQDANNCNISVTSVYVMSNNPPSETSYLLVADSTKRLHFFLNDSLVTSLSVPAVVSSMCSGYFVNESEKVKGFKREQVAIATTSGALYILSNLAILPYYNLQYPLTTIRSLIMNDELDAIVCTGHFNSLCILRNKCCVATFTTVDWVHTFDLTANKNILALGSLDRTVQLVKIVKKRQ